MTMMSITGCLSFFGGFVEFIVESPAMTDRVSKERIAELHQSIMYHSTGGFFDIRTAELLDLLADRADMEAANEKLNAAFLLSERSNDILDGANAAKDTEIARLKDERHQLSVDFVVAKDQLAAANKRIAELEATYINLDTD